MKGSNGLDYFIAPAAAATTYSGTATTDTLANIAQDQLLVSVGILALLVVAIAGIAAVLGRLR